MLIGGEPTLYSNLVKLIKYIKSKEIKVCIATNGRRLSNFEFAKEIVEAGVDSINISLKGVSENEYLESTKSYGLEEAIKGNITKLKNDENRLLELLLTNKLDEEMLINKMNTIVSERKNLENKKEKLEVGASLNFNKDLVKLYEDKNIGEIEGINPIWNILSREGKKEIISTFIKHIDISTGKDYNVKIENITFNNRFLQNEFFDIPTYLLDKLKGYYKNIKFLGMFTKEQIKNITTNELYSYNELMKNYTNDRKSLDIILNKYKDFNIEIAMIIEDKKFIDAVIMFN